MPIAQIYMTNEEYMKWVQMTKKEQDNAKEMFKKKINKVKQNGND